MIYVAELVAFVFALHIPSSTLSYSLYKFFMDLTIR